LRACEIKALQWKHISWEDRRLSVRRSKTPAGWRDPSLNETCFDALRELHGRAERLGFDASEHFLFPWHGQHKRLDPTRPMTSWRTAWRSLRKAAGLPNVRFHDGRHTALTRLAEKGLPDWVIRAQFGHVSPSMMAVYSHVRRKALDEAAKALEPETTAVVPPIPTPSKTARREGVTSHVTSQQQPKRNNVIEFASKSGAPCKTRTCDLLVRSQTLYPTELRARKPRLYHPRIANRYNRPVSVTTHRNEAPAHVRCFVLTISDTRTAETDTSGEAIAHALKDAGHDVVGRRIVRDDPADVRETVRMISAHVQVIVTTGGTGITARDSTYEAIVTLVDKRLDGFGELFRMLSYEEIGSAAMLSRACAGSIGTTAIFSLPGSEAAVRLAMEKLILPEIGHVVRELSR